MELEERIKKLEKSLKGKIKYRIKKDQIEKAAQVVLDNFPEVLKLTERYIPPKAKAMLNLRESVGFNGSYSYNSEEEGKKKKELCDGSFRLEKDLMKARYPRRVQRLFAEAKPIIEKRYGRTFENRGEFAVMGSLHERAGTVTSDVEELKEALRKTRVFEGEGIVEIGALKPEVRKEVHDFYRQFMLKREILDVGERFLGLLRDTRKTDTMFKYVEDHFDGGPNEPQVVHNHVPLGSDDSYDYEQRELTDILAKTIIFGREGKLSFGLALALFEGEHYTRDLGFEGISREVPHWGQFWEIPENIQTIISTTLKERYGQRETDKEVQKYLQKLKETVLQRWKSTAVDYEKVIHHHSLNKWDEDMVTLFYQIKQGAKEISDNKLIYEGRLPEFLRVLVADGIIQTSEIDPPLKESYRRSNEVLSNLPRNLLPNKHDDAYLIELPKRKGEGIIKTEGTQKLLPSPESTLENIAADMSRLKEYIDVTKTHYFLGRGQHSAFFVREEYFPNGELAVGQIYRFTVLKDDASAKDGIEVVVGGNKINIKKEKCYEVEWKMREDMWNSNSNFLRSRSYTAIVDCSPSEFYDKYFKDFMIHALIHLHPGSFSELKDSIESIDKIKTPFVESWLGPFAHVQFKTFQIGDKFCFCLKHEHEAADVTVPFIAKTLVDYISEVGLDFHYENDLDESDRAQLTRKLEDRKFEKEHIGEIITELQGSGLVRVLSNLLTNSNSREAIYRTHGFNTSRNPCETCKEKYIEGEAQYSTARDSFQDKIYIRDLHELSRHPHTFTHQFGNLKTIYRMINDSKDHQIPFVSSSELENEILEFANAFDKSVQLRGETFDGYMSGGDPSIWHEPEEIEDNPTLKKMQEQYDALTTREREAQKIANDAAIKLQRKYEQIMGLPKDESELWKISNFWTTQLQLYNIYRVASPRLLADHSQKMIDIPVNFGNM